MKNTKCVNHEGVKTPYCPKCGARLLPNNMRGEVTLYFANMVRISENNVHKHEEKCDDYSADERRYYDAELSRRKDIVELWKKRLGWVESLP